MRLRRSPRRPTTPQVAKCGCNPLVLKALLSCLAFSCLAIQFALHVVSPHAFQQVDLDHAQQEDSSTKHRLQPPGSSLLKLEQIRRLKDMMDEKRASAGPPENQDTGTTEKKNLTKPVPATSMCTDVQCKIKACPEIPGAAPPELPVFMKQYPSAHYGYGFVQRAPEIRGERMQTSGSASAGSGCAASHKYQFLFVHVLKSGGTTMKAFLEEALCGNTIEPCANGSETLEIVNCASAIKKYPHYFVFSFVRNPYSRMYSAYAMAHNFRDKKATPQLRPFSFEEFVLGTTHPPPPPPPPAVDENSIPVLKHSMGAAMPQAQSHRMLIAPDAEGNIIPHPHPHFDQQKFLWEHQQQHQYLHRRESPFVQYPKSPGLTPVAPKDQDHESLHQLQQLPPPPPRYRRPITPARIRTFRSKLSYLSPSHWTPQTKFLFSKQNCPVIDFIGHLETLSEDLQKVLAYIDSPELWRYFYAQSNQTNAKIKTDNSTNFGARERQKLSGGGNLQTVYQYDPNQATRQQMSPIQEAVYNEFKIDFDLLGYDPFIVPA